MTAAPVSHQGVLVSEPGSTLWAGKSLFRAVHLHMHLMQSRLNKKIENILSRTKMVTLMSVTSALHFVHSHSRTPVCCFRSWLQKKCFNYVLVTIECHTNGVHGALSTLGTLPFPYSCVLLSIVAAKIVSDLSQKIG